MENINQEIAELKEKLELLLKQKEVIQFLPIEENHPEPIVKETRKKRKREYLEEVEHEAIKIIRKHIKTICGGKDISLSFSDFMVKIRKIALEYHMDFASHKIAFYWLQRNFKGVDRKQKMIIIPYDSLSKKQKI